MSRVRSRVYFSGRVQGVGFRNTSQRLAQELGVAGYVRNLPDGRVELVAEAARPEVEALLRSIDHHLGQYIRDIQLLDEPPDHPPLLEFSIRH